MDCHNRPSHIYYSPDHSVDVALLIGRVDPSLPYMKEKAVSVMAKVYQTEPEALQAIANEITGYYQTEYPDVFAGKRTAIDASISAIQEAFSQNIFPEMKVRWDKYSSNLGHFTSPGCMRCHKSSMVSDKGQRITTDCRACHNILSQGSGDQAQMASNPDGLDFVHPVDIDDAWKETGCFECHSGVQP
jgi:hypothetical protein